MVRSSLSAVALALLATGSLAAQGRSESGAFIIRLGTDTIAVERFTRTGDRLSGEQVLRSPRTTIRRYTIALGADGAPSRLESGTERPGAPPDSAAPEHTTVTLGADSATVVTRQGDSTRATAIATKPGVIPMPFPSYAPFELAIARARRVGRDKVELPVYFLGFPELETLAVERLSADSVTLTTFFGTARARVDGAGRLLGVHAPGSNFQASAERVPSVDIAAFAADFAAREKSGQPMGVLSPRDTVEATAGGAKLAVDYSRPSRRGRVIFGHVVPWDKVWRTGANEATQLTTDRDLKVKGLTVPAGSYSLFTIPARSGWTLIINKETGQSGAEYQEAQDVGRVKMETQSLSEPVEQFTITVEPNKEGGVLRLAWDSTQASVPFRVK